MAFYRICPGCGANLDPGETCDECREREEKTKENSRSAAAQATPIRIITMSEHNRRLPAAAGWAFSR